MNFVPARRGSRLFAAVVSASIALAFVAALAFAARATAAETIYWDNYSANPDNVAFANIDGSGGGLLNLGSSEVVNPEGMAYDSVTNRLFVASEAGASGQILAVNLDGSGATPFTAPGAPIEEPEGVAVDPVARKIYWENTEGSGSIVWANLDGSAGGVLNTTGATINGPCCRIAVDPVGGRVYWVNGGATPETISYANVDNSGGGDLNLAGSTVEPGGEGILVDSAAGRVYFTGGTNEVGYANVNGSGGGDVPTTGAVVNGPYGIALDPSIGRLYLANYSNGPTASNAIGFLNLAGGGGAITPASAPVNGPQDPVVIKVPAGTGAPVATKDATNPAALSCPTGSWGADYAGSFVYQAPRSFGYQWLLNGAAVSGATASTFTATTAGSYTCTVTATNQAGSASQTSAGVPVTAATLKLKGLTKKPHAKAGKPAVIKVQIANGGDLGSGSLRLCVQVPKKQRKYVKAPKCASIGKVSAHKTKTATLRVKTTASASGSYKLSILTKGASVKPLKASIKVKPMTHQHKRSKHHH